jgi:cytidylate kinase
LREGRVRDEVHREVKAMAVMTISRELGSEGVTIAKKVAQELGYHFVDKDVIEKVLDQYGFVRFQKEYESGPGFWARFDGLRTRMVEFSYRVIQSLARHGNVVIVGRGSFAVLQGFADVLNVRIQAPFPIRVRRVMEQQGIAEADKAEAFVKESDRVRTAFVESWYGIKWDTASAFDMMLDTGKVSPDMAAAWLVAALNALRERPVGGDQRTTNTIQVDYLLDNVISQTLDCQVTH